MLITVKTLQQQQFTVEVDPNETIAAVKSKIEKSQNQPASWQKLIYSGKVLEDNTTIGSANVKDGEFLVLMVRKPKEEPAKAAPTPTATTSTSTEKPAQPQVPVSSPAPSQPAEKPATPTQEPTQASATPSTGIVMGAEYERTITQLCEMGFPREDVIRALRAAFNNPDRAVEYLFNGIPNMPDIPQVQQRAPQTPAPVSTASTPQTPTTPQQPAQTGQPTLSPNTPLIPPQFLGQQPQPSTPSTGTGVFDFLRQHPQFNALRMLVQQQPELLQPVLAQLAQANPNILQLINQHQQEFIQLLNEPVQPGSPGQPGFPGMPPMPGGPQYIQVTTEEKAAIDRLEKMGFERSLVIEAFFACDRDEEMAANYLLEHMHEDFEEDPQQQ